MKHFVSLWTNERLLAVVATVAATVAYHWLVVNVELIPPAVALLWPFVIWAGFVGGIQPGVVSALFISGYALYSLPADGTPRVVIILIGTLTGAVLTGYRTQQLKKISTALEVSLESEKKARLQAEYAQHATDFVNDLDGGIELLKDVLAAIESLMSEWTSLSLTARWDAIGAVKHDLVNLLTNIGVWRQLAMVRELVLSAGEERTRLRHEEKERKQSS